jgi:N6-adenosine-specific RNA methylase IME4
MKYRTILVDPPYPQPMTGAFKSRHVRPKALPYKSMTIEQIKALDIEQYAEPGSHIWLWATNTFHRDAFDILAGWGFKFLNEITWVKPSGLGAYFANTTQPLLFGYYKKCQFHKARWRPTHIHGNVKPGEHSKKPESSYKLIEDVSDEYRIELFARFEREGWTQIGDELGVPITLQPSIMTKERIG